MSDEELSPELREEFEQAQRDPKSFMRDLSDMARHALHAWVAITIVMRDDPARVSFDLVWNPSLDEKQGLALAQVCLETMLGDIKRRREAG